MISALGKIRKESKLDDNYFKIINSGRNEKTRRRHHLEKHAPIKITFTYSLTLSNILMKHHGGINQRKVLTFRLILE